jgi:formate hydrogenlyase transcriptional activator
MRKPSTPAPTAFQKATATNATWAILERHPWPGNVRELENYLQRALILSSGPDLQLPELPSRPGARPRGPGALPQAGRPAEAPPRTFEVEVRELLERALRACDGRVYGPRGAAALLGLKPTTLQGKLRRHRVPLGR